MSVVRGPDPDLSALYRAVTELADRFPFVKPRTVGKSVMGREIPALRLGQAGGGVLLVGGIHGTHRLSPLLLLRFAERLAEAYQRDGEIAEKPAFRILSGNSVTIVPVLNPDGYEIALKGPAGAGPRTAAVHLLCDGAYETWNANARGVDLNHNFDAGWPILRGLERQSGIYGPAPAQYGGPAPESEPETAALAELCRKERFRQALVLMQGRCDALYWSYGEQTPVRSKKIARLLCESAGFALEEPMGFVTHGGFKEWFMTAFRRPAFAVTVHTADSAGAVLGDTYSRLEALLTLSLIL